MSIYIHEIVLQEFIIENISNLNIIVKYNKTSYFRIIEARFNRLGTFWDLEGKLENGIWIPIEVEWITNNFKLHKHHLSKDFKRFIDLNGVLLVLRKNIDIPLVQQLSLLDTLSESKFSRDFDKWFRKKSSEYIKSTLRDFFIGNYKRDIPRIILYPISIKARKNYFENGDIYKKTSESPNIIGFTENAFKNNIFIRDLQPNDICLFIDADGLRQTRKKFVENIVKGNICLKRLVAYKINSKIIDRRNDKIISDEFYWADEEKERKLIYPYICLINEKPFLDIKDKNFPFIKNYNDANWEAFRSCIQHGEYKELNSLDFSMLLSNLS